MARGALRGATLIGTLAVVAGNYGAVGLAFLTNVLLARALGATEFGRLALLLMGSQILLTLSSTWTQPALIRFGAQEHALRGSMGNVLAARAFILVLALTLVLSLVWGLRTALAAYFEIPEAGIALLGLHLVAATCSQTVGGIFQASRRLVWYGGILFAERSVTLGVLLFTALVVPLTAPLCLAAGALGSFTVAGGGSIAAARLGLLAGFRVERQRVGELWRFSLPQIGGSWAGLFGSQWIDYIVIRQFLSVAEVGVYALAFQIAGAIQQVTIIAANIDLPRYSAMVARAAHREIRSIFQRVVPTWLLLFSVAVGSTLLLAGILVPAIFGERFAGAVAPLSLLLVASMAVALYNATYPALTAYGIVWPVTAAVVTSVGTNVALDLILIPRYGVSGSAAATLVAYALSAATLVFVAHRRLGLPALRPLVSVVPVPLAYIVMSVFGGAIGYGSAGIVILVSGLVAIASLRQLGWPGRERSDAMPS